MTSTIIRLKRALILGPRVSPLMTDDIRLAKQNFPVMIGWHLAPLMYNSKSVESFLKYECGKNLDDMDGRKSFNPKKVLPFRNYLFMCAVAKFVRIISSMLSRQVVRIL